MCTSNINYIHGKEEIIGKKYSMSVHSRKHSDWQKKWCLSYKNNFMVGGRFAIKLKPGVTPKLEVMLLPQSSL